MGIKRIKEIMKRDGEEYYKNICKEKMIYKILNDYEIRRYKPRGKNACLIRVLEPEYKKYGIPYSVNHLAEFHSVMELYFHDIREWLPRQERFILFNKDMAISVIDLINQNQFDEIIVHCNEGQSRSVGIMIGISILLNDSRLRESIELDKFYMPNPIVVEVFKQVLNLL
ncbi:hypothetical protein [Bacillus cereus group sp. BfR-BA-01317]|uniref:hypothetical protein n=1 Tax=Bacillus cereus group sp. BfR-BA-01317 TaxID=2920294 RepID=UPI001F58A281|nr:hypothetical protein [Bacillus cereus group sp. BfR-BA-01317]